MCCSTSPLSICSAETLSDPFTCPAQRLCRRDVPAPILTRGWAPHPCVQRAGDGLDLLCVRGVTKNVLGPDVILSHVKFTHMRARAMSVQTAAVVSRSCTRCLGTEAGRLRWSIPLFCCTADGHSLGEGLRGRGAYCCSATVCVCVCLAPGLHHANRRI